MRASPRSWSGTRRRFLAVAGGGLGTLLSGLPALAAPGTPEQPASYAFAAAPMQASLGGRTVNTWGYNGVLAGPEVRVTEGDTLQVAVHNQLPADTTIHWHGLPIVNAMDGVPDVTQPPIAPGQTFTYSFTVPVAGTYFYHSHDGLQLDRALRGPLISQARQESLSYDREFVVILDDWLDGLPGTPDHAYANLKAHGSGMVQSGGMSMSGGMGTPAAGAAPPEWAPDIVYPDYLLNGRPSASPDEFDVRRGDKVRLRLINAGSATIFRVALAGHQLTVTHTDGQPVAPVAVDAVRLGMGERYDVLVTADNPGIWPLVAQAEGTMKSARAIVRYAGINAATPPAMMMPAELGRHYLDYDMLRTTANRRLPSGNPDQAVKVELGGDERRYIWTINGEVYPHAEPIPVQRNGHIRFEFNNPTGMSHPMHLHGPFFQVATSTGHGPLKDTVLIDPGQKLTIDWIADNPGNWAFHCHHGYHQAAGMMRVVTVA